MNASKTGGRHWVDPDDAPDMSQAEAEIAVWQVGQRPASQGEVQAALSAARRGPGRPVGSVQAERMERVTLRLTPEALAKWRASGKGWQTRAAQVLAKAAPGSL